MATVPVPRTYVASENLTATILNGTTGVKGPLDFLLSPPRCYLYQTSTTNMGTSGTAAEILWDTELYDTDTMHSTSSNTGRITCNAAGLYLITGILGFAANSTGYRRVDLRKNGTIFATVSLAATATLSAAVPISAYVQLSVGEYVQMYGTQTSGGALATVAGTDWSRFTAQWVANS